MDSVFIVEHLHRHEGGEENVKMIGAYRTKEAARSAVERLRVQPGFRDLPRIVDALRDEDNQGFYIQEYPLDKDHWCEGYVTW